MIRLAPFARDDMVSISVAGRVALPSQPTAT
jgi:hypothetical protein